MKRTQLFQITILLLLYSSCRINAEVNVDEEIPTDQEIVATLEVDEVSSEGDNNKNLNNDLENNSDSI